MSTFAGHLAKEPERKSNGSGKEFALLKVAVPRRFEGSDPNNKPAPSFIQVRVFGPQGQNALKYLVKGQEVAVTGELVVGSYEKDGTWHNFTYVLADDVSFGRKPQGQSSGTTGGAHQADYDPSAGFTPSGGDGSLGTDVPFTDEDVPF